MWEVLTDPQELREPLCEEQEALPKVKEVVSKVREVKFESLYPGKPSLEAPPSRPPPEPHQMPVTPPEV